MASTQFRSRSGCGTRVLFLVGCIAWSLGGAALIPLGLNPARLRPTDLQSWSVEELKEMKGKLWRELKDVRLPRPTSFTANGEEYPLPYSIKEMPPETPSEEMLGYLSGFFAGDGCVHSDRSRLSLGQSIQGAEVLLLFAKCFGGSIGLQSKGSGACLPALLWQVHGPRSRKQQSCWAKPDLKSKLSCCSWRIAAARPVTNS